MNTFQRCKNDRNRLIIAIDLKFRKFRFCQIYETLKSLDRIFFKKISNKFVKQ